MHDCFVNMHKVKDKPIGLSLTLRVDTTVTSKKKIVFFIYLVIDSIKLKIENYSVIEYFSRPQSQKKKLRM